jgi:cytosine deaminase
MENKYEILIRNAKLRSSNEQLFDIGILNGKIATIAERIAEPAEVVLDAGKKLVTESFVNTHMHLCKVYTLMMMDDEALKTYQTGGGMGKSMTGIELAMRIKEKYDESWITPNVRKAIAQAAMYGCTHVRAFVDVDTKARLEGVKAVIKVRDEFRDVVDIQVCAFAQDGLVREPGARELMHQAMEMGCDVAGGIPWIEYTDADIAEHVRQIFDLAVEFNTDVSMLVDDSSDPGLRSLELQALEAIKRGWQGRSLGHHARAMSNYPLGYFQKLSHILKKAEMGVVSDPHTGPLHARVRELLENGNLVCLGQDDISDAYYPYGRNNMLEVAFLNSHLLWFMTREDMEILYDMITLNAAKCINVSDYGLKIGATANLVILTQPNTLESLRFHEAPAHVISHGKLVDREAIKKLAFPE